MVCMGEGGKANNQSKGAARIRAAGSLRIAAVFSRDLGAVFDFARNGRSKFLGRDGRLTLITVPGNCC